MAGASTSAAPKAGGASTKSKAREGSKGKVVDEPTPKKGNGPKAKETDEITAQHRRMKKEYLGMALSNIEAAEAFEHPAVKRQIDRANRAIEDVFRCFFVRDRVCLSSALQGVAMKASNFEAFRTHVIDASDTIRTLTVPNSPRLMKARREAIQELERKNGLIIVEKDTLRKGAEITKALKAYKPPARDAYGMLGRFLFGIIED